MLIYPPPAWDWINLSMAAGRPDPYAAGPGFRWSPVTAWLLVPVVAAGWQLFVVAHFAVLGFLRDWRVIAIVLLAWPFWVDVMWGNVVAFAFVAAYAALSGSRRATWILFVLTLLVPRPLMLPAVVWILWRRPRERIPFAALFVVHAALVLATGLGGEWIARLLEANELGHPANYAPSRFIGLAWMPIGAVLAAWLTWRGRVGLASLAIQPYWLPYYLLFAALPGGLPMLSRPLVNGLNSRRDRVTVDHVPVAAEDW